LAESSTISYGRYLRTLRERQGLSLLRVCELSAGFADPIDKGTLSRYEHGRQAPAIFKLVPLARIYGVSADALVERLELDRELHRTGAPTTAGLSFVELQRLGKRSLVETDRKWDAYGYLRDALSPENTKDRSQGRLAAARMNFITAARALGMNRFALHELRHLEASQAVEPHREAILFERLANCYRCLGEFDQGRAYADRAIASAEHLKEWRVLAYAYLARANLALDRGDPESAIQDQKRVFHALRRADGRKCLLEPNASFAAGSLNLLAESYLELKQLERSKRAALAAKKLSGDNRLPGALGFAEVTLGRLDELQGLEERARDRWSEAGRIAKAIRNTKLEFTAEFFVFRQVTLRGDSALARASRRRLERLEPCVPAHLPLLEEYRELTATGSTHSAFDARPQRRHRTGAGAQIRRNEALGRRPGDSLTKGEEV